MKLVIMIPLFLAAIIVLPLALIWSLNTLFVLAIPFTLKTWLAAVIVGAYVGGRSIKS